MLEEALNALVTHYDGTQGKPELEIVLPAGNAYLSEGHVACVGPGTTQAGGIEWMWRLPPDNSVLCFAEIWMSTNDASGVVVTLRSPSGLISTSTTGPIPPPNGTPFPSFTGAYAPLTWGSSTVWLLAVEPTIATSGFVPEHGDWMIRIDGVGANAKVHAYAARSDPNMDVRSGAKLSHFVDPKWQQTRSADASCNYANGEFDQAGSQIHRNGTLNGIATASVPAVHVAGGYIISNRRKSRYSSAGPARGGTRYGPDYVLPSDESYALAGIRAGGNRSRAVFRLVGTSTAAPQLARQLAKLGSGLLFPPPTDVPSLTDVAERERRGGGNIEPVGSGQARPAVGVDSTKRNLAGDNPLDLPHRFQRLALDRRRRQAADMRRRDDVRQSRQFRRRHLVQRAADIHRGAGDAVLAQCR